MRELHIAIYFSKGETERVKIMICQNYEKYLIEVWAFPKRQKES